MSWLFDLDVPILPRPIWQVFWLKWESVTAANMFSHSILYLKCFKSAKVDQITCNQLGGYAESYYKEDSNYNFTVTILTEWLKAISESMLKK